MAWTTLRLVLPLTALLALSGCMAESSHEREESCWMFCDGQEVEYQYDQSIVLWPLLFVILLVTIVIVVVAAIQPPPAQPPRPPQPPYPPQPPR